MPTLVQIKTVKFVTAALLKDGQRACALHGQMPQAEREKVCGTIRLEVTSACWLNTPTRIGNRR